MFLNIKNVVVACFLSFLLSVSVFAHDMIEKPNTFRKGFTLELGLGLGYNLDSASRKSKGGNKKVFATNLVLGGYINPKFALLYHTVAGVIFSGTDSLGNYTIQSLYVHYWLNDDIFIGGGPSLGFLIGIDTFLLISGRAGYVIVSQGNHALNISLNISDSVFPNIDSSLDRADIRLSWNFL